MDAGTTKKRILIVDDEIALALLYKAALEAQGYEVMHTDNGELALQTAREFHPDLILLDLMMPRLSGFDAIDLFRSTPETATSSIIILSALSQPEDVAKAKGLGADDYIVKSDISIQEVVARITACLNTVKQDLDPTTL